MRERGRIPVVLLTGFLGAGKTSVLSRVLRDPRFPDTAVIINEFGDIGLDHVLVEHVPDDAVVEMTSGCLCCTIRGDIRQTLLMLHHRAETGELPLFARVVIETTGLADPAPVVHTLINDLKVSTRFKLAGVVTAVDAVNGLQTLATHSEAMKQAVIADRILVTKTDLPAGHAALPALVAELERLAPGAAILDPHAAEFDLRQAIDGMGGFDAGAKPAQVVDWLNAQAHLQLHVGHQHEHGHDHVHDVNRHSDDIRAFCLTLDQPLDPAAFSFALELLAGHQGPDLLRVKGLVAISDYPDQPVVIHMVQHLIEPPIRLESWPDQDRRSRLVFITRNIDPARLAAFMGSWTRAEPDMIRSLA